MPGISLFSRRVVYPMSSPRPSYYRTANRITMPAHSVQSTTKSRANIPRAFRDTFTLYPVRAGRNAGARRSLSLAGFSRCRFAAPRRAALPRRSRSFSDPLKRVGGERQKNSAVVRCAKYHAISWRVTRRSFFLPASLGEYYRSRPPKVQSRW